DADDDVLEIGGNRAIDLIVARESGVRLPRGKREQVPARVLGADPETGAELSVKDGRYGPYVTDGKTNATIPKSLTPDAVPMDDAVTLLAARRAAQAAAAGRALGEDPDSGAAVFVKAGRYGPYVTDGKTNATLPKSVNPDDVTLEEARALIAAKKSGAGATTARLLGEDPESKATITVKDGRYGPYVTDGKTNATLPKTTGPDEVTLEQAIGLLAARRSVAGAAPRKSAAAPSTKKKSAAKKKKPRTTKKPAK
ncbi:MAG: DNA topoisomerase I, partial [Methylobacteriaceae bacterium]|nr:DNA topoisomerase I [Methylobacteriaceae bacterium]